MPWAVLGGAVKISYAVCGHEDRRAAAKALADSLDAWLALDNGTYGELGNHDRAWRYGALFDSDWTVVLEDDALPVPNFDQHVQAALGTLPAEPCAVSLYVGTSRPPRSEEHTSELQSRFDIVCRLL